MPAMLDGAGQIRTPRAPQPGALSARAAGPGPRWCAGLSGVAGSSVGVIQAW